MASTSINAQLALSDYFIINRDHIILSRIYNQLLNNFPDYAQKAKTVFVLGGIGENAREKDIYGASHLANPERTADYLRCFGIEMPPKLRNPEKKRKILMSEQVKKMPAYPQKGFIDIVDDTLVMKFSGRQP